MSTRPLTGFQKSQLQAAKRKEKEEKAKAEIAPLDPEFPYSVQSFDFAIARLKPDPIPKQ